MLDCGSLAVLRHEDSLEHVSDKWLQKQASDTNIPVFPCEPEGS